MVELAADSEIQFNFTFIKRVLIMNYIKEIASAIEQSESLGRVMHLDGVTGLSGDKLIGLLQRCAKISSTDNVCYLELGVFQGLTLSSVAAVASALPCFGIDNFSQNDADSRNRQIMEERLSKHTSGNASLINEDFEDALLSLPNHIGDKLVSVYFIDGPHDYRSQYLSLEFALPYLAEEVVILIDDSNYEHVRRANADWLKANPEFALLFEAYTPSHPGNIESSDLNTVKESWWDGLNVIVRDTNNVLPRSYPPVASSRERYFNDHLVHADRHAELAPRLLSVFSLSILLAFAGFTRLLFERWKFRNRFRSMNTYSEELQPTNLLTDSSHSVPKETLS
jgi:hypothetical protein